MRHCSIALEYFLPTSSDIQKPLVWHGLVRQLYSFVLVGDGRNTLMKSCWLLWHKAAWYAWHCVCVCPFSTSKSVSVQCHLMHLGSWIMSQHGISSVSWRFSVPGWIFLAPKQWIDCGNCLPDQEKPGLSSTARVKLYIIWQQTSHYLRLPLQAELSGSASESIDAEIRVLKCLRHSIMPCGTFFAMTKSLGCRLWNWKLPPNAIHAGLAFRISIPAACPFNPVAIMKCLQSAHSLHASRPMGISVD